MEKKRSVPRGSLKVQFLHVVGTKLKPNACRPIVVFSRSIAKETHTETSAYRSLKHLGKHTKTEVKLIIEGPKVVIKGDDFGDPNINYTTPAPGKYFIDIYIGDRHLRFNKKFEVK